MKILLLEDDVLLNEIIHEHLEEQEHEIISVFDGNTAQELAYEQVFDLFLFDVNTPRISGFELLEDLRNKGISTPTIFITSLNMIDDVEKGFNVGANDYIKKPFELKELDLRIRNLKTIFNIDIKESLEIANDTFLCKNNLSLIIKKQEFNLTQKEYDILIYLVNNKHKHISIDELSLNVWSYEQSPYASTIRTYIKNLRKILGEDAILNIRGVGYRFNK